MELPYPYYRLQADGPRETGCLMTIVIGDGVGGPLAGTTARGIVEDLARRLKGDPDDGVTVQLVLNSITAENLES
ncbi:hypothetical protein ABZ650_20640 [Streptomyces griseoviridis]|uniref:hypothetical protein n=1 Tax=Streptomyces griseoviridis TaxID=45398 RepID=UPI0033F642E9